MSLEQNRISIPDQESSKDREIRREIEIYRKDYVKKFGTEENWRSHLLNNFHLHLPHENPGLMIYRNMITFIDKEAWNKPFGEIMSIVSGGREGGATYSELFLNQTPKEFYAVVDEVTEMRKIDPKKIFAVKEQSQEKMNKLLMPIYVDLRKKGYSRYKDLTA